MLPTNPEYFCFLAVVFLGFWLLRRFQPAIILLICAANLFFYAKSGSVYTILIPAATFCDYFLGRAIFATKQKSARRFFVMLSVVMNVGLIAGARGFFLPVSLSFYAFQALTYTLDIYRDDSRPATSYWRYLASVTFFPTILAGPITRVSSLLPQWKWKGAVLSGEDGSRALFLIGLGLSKKFLIADYLGNNLVNRVFDLPTLYSGGDVLLAVYAYAFQLYYDFSGYSDIAIGAALLLGIRLPANFNRPYQALDLADFWRRWHISFSNWLRDYLYFSLPGKRTRLMPYVGLVITMAVGGLWHGAGWTFLIWGVLHGCGLVAARLWRASKRTMPAIPAGILTFHFVLFCWIFFRAANLETALKILGQISAFRPSFPNATPQLMGVLAIAVAGHFLPKNWLDRTLLLFARAPAVLQAASLAGLVFAIQSVGGTGAAPFIYSKILMPRPMQTLPRKTSLTIASFIAIAALLPHGVRPAQLFATFVLVPPVPKAVPTAKPAPVTAAPETTAHVAPETPPPVPNLIVPPHSLDHFFASLGRTEARQPGAVTLVLHYGDSPTTADSITADVRRILQARFGDAGHGFVLAAKPWAWYNHNGIKLDAHSWLINPASQDRARDGIHGLGGVSFTGEPGAVSRVTLPDTAYARALVYYLAQPGGGSFTISAGSTNILEVSTSAEQKQPAFAGAALPAGTQTVELSVTSGTVRLFGWRFDKDQPGVEYSSLGINGAQVEMMDHFFESAQWTAALKHENPALVILNYGTNESIYPDYVEKEYPAQLREAISRIRAALPETSILVMGPMDRGVMTAGGDISTPETLEKLVATQERIAGETGCAFFNTFEAMGGAGTMARWYHAQPRLVSADFMHPLPAGAAIVGQLFAAALVDQYEKSK